MTKKVLVVDDSRLMRRHLGSILQKAGFQVAEAIHGDDCLKQIPQYKPDVITLDINMPVMDGMACLEQIVQHHQIPVVMVSSLTAAGALATFKALEIGAVDYVAKPDASDSLNMFDSAQHLIEKVTAASESLIARSRSFKTRLRLKQEKAALASRLPTIRSATATAFANKAELVLIGVSTGGPSCLQEILQHMPATCSVPIVIAQHMPARFTSVFAQRLNSLCKLNVQELTDLTKLEAGNVYIAKGDADLQFSRQNGQLMLNSTAADSHYLWHPSVSKMVKSAMEQLAPNKLVCVQLTGMGNDGASEMKQAHTLGATTIAESKDTAIVYGMPRELVLQGGASFELPNFKIAQAILNAI